MIKLKADDLRHTVPLPEHLREVKSKRREIYFILDNILDTYNIGGIFRLADAIGVKKVYICGESETPPNHKIKKASINTTEWIEWQYFADAKSAIDHLRSTIDNLMVVAVEQDKRSVSYTEIDYKMPIAFVVGNETSGCLKETLDACDKIVEIPMWGVNISLNVIISLGVVSYNAIKSLS
jgi:23S rRNA (guanosine2251-2'-O)-methyltransferase